MIKGRRGYGKDGLPYDPAMRLPLALALAWCTACASFPPSPEAVVDMEKARFAAMVKRDVNALEPLLADDLVYCHSHGLCETKAEFLATIRSGRLAYRAIEVLDLRTRDEGDAVVVNGSIAIEGVMGGETVHMRLVFTDVYAPRDGRMRLTAWQSTRLP
jgi:Domain of unknown function (DUF4440)